MNSNYIISLQSQTAITDENNWSSTFGMMGQFFFLILVFAAILFLAYFSIKKLSDFKIKSAGNFNMEIIYAMPMGGSNTIQLIRIGKRYFLIGVTRENISLITEIDADDIPKTETKKNQKSLFEKYLYSYFDKNKNENKDKDKE